MMATCTAMGFLGKYSLYQGGIEIMHTMRLYENDKSTICIETPAAFNRDGKMKGIWWSTQNVLDDMMLLAAVYALEDDEVIDACRDAGCPQNTLTDPWPMFDAQKQLPTLYEMAKKAFHSRGAKLVLVSLTGSQMAPFMEKAKEYPIDLELCPAVFERNARWG